MQEKWKVGGIFLAIHVSTPISTSLIWFCCPKSHHTFLIFLAASDQKSSPSLSTPFPLSLFFFLSSSVASTRQPSLSHQHNIFLSKEEIKGLTLKFQLPSLWVSNQTFICLFLFLYLLSWFYRLNYDSVLVIEGLMIFWSIECLLGYFNMYTVGIKIPKLN